MDNRQSPLVSGPQPSLLAQLMATFRAWRAQRAARRTVDRSSRPAEAPAPQPKSSLAEFLAKANASRPRVYGATLWERTLAIAFILPWTVLLIFPVAAQYLGQLDAAIAWVLTRVPVLARLEPHVRALAWQAPLAAAGTFALRLLALKIALRNGVNAAAPCVLAMLIDEASWFLWSRDRMAAGGVDPAQQAAAVRFMVIYGISTLCIWSVYGPDKPRRLGQPGPAFDDWR